MSQAMMMKLFSVGTEKAAEPGKPLPRIGIMMAPKGRMVAVTTVPDKESGQPRLAIAALVPANSVAVFHPIHIVSFDQTVTPMLGRKFGALIGMTDTPAGTAFVFADEPATTVDGLVGMEAKGNG